ncbi:MAG: 16S rRNA processing protein RimM [Gammaproteobacteria bacterium]|nr:16S rRNA processing protein RimM [Gammaproteobacteria bacterium]
MGSPDTELTVIGEISSPYGVRGWVRVRSYTRPPEEILGYACWTLTPRNRSGGPGDAGRPAEARQSIRVMDSLLQKKHLVVKLEGISSRDEAASLSGMQVCIPAGDLPDLPAGEYYWSQLIGLEVANLAGESLGTVDHLVETGANDVLVVKYPGVDADAERLIPWIPQVIRAVDIGAGSLLVDWEGDY